MKKDFGRNLWRVRKDRGLTQEQLAAKLQQRGIMISRGTYAKIEAGIRGISIQELHAIRDILGAAWNDLLGE